MQGVLEKEYENELSFSTAGSLPIKPDKRKFETLTDDERRNLRLVKGHINYGIHSLLNRPVWYVTMLREPIERVISNYFYIKRNPDHYLYESITSNDWSIDDFIYKTTDNDNGQTRVLAGVADYFDCQKRHVPFGECTGETLEIAKSNLRKFAFVGLTERYDESIALMKQILKWKSIPDYGKDNATEGRPRKEDIPIKALALIEKYNEYDLELYELGRELFDKSEKLK